MVTYRERSDRRSVPREPAEAMVEEVKESDPMKPWTLVSRVDGDDETLRTEVLKPLVVEGVLTITADGDLRLYKPELLERLSKVFLVGKCL